MPVFETLPQVIAQANRALRYDAYEQLVLQSADPAWRKALRSAGHRGGTAPHATLHSTPEHALGCLAVALYEQWGGAS